MKIFGLNLFGKKDSKGKEMEENKIQMLAQIELLIPIANSLLINLTEKTTSEIAQTNIKKIRYKISKVKDNLEDAVEYLKVLNLKSALNELKSAEKEVNQIQLNKVLGRLIELRIISKNDTGNLLILKSNLIRLIKNLSNLRY